MRGQEPSKRASDQRRPGNDELRTTAFSLFYMAINIGAATSQVFVPKIKDNYGYFLAFLFPAALMAVAFVVFAAGNAVFCVRESGDVAWRFHAKGKVFTSPAATKQPPVKCASKAKNWRRSAPVRPS